MTKLNMIYLTYRKVPVRKCLLVFNGAKNVLLQITLHMYIVGCCRFHTIYASKTTERPNFYTSFLLLCMLLVRGQLYFGHVRRWKQMFFANRTCFSCFTYIITL